MGRMIPYIIEHKKCLKPPTSLNMELYHRAWVSAWLNCEDPVDSRKITSPSKNKIC
jgi:hypothetical protein